MYEPTNWAKGDKIVADKLNHIEAGVEQASMDEIHAKVQIDPQTLSYIDDTFELISGSEADLVNVPNVRIKLDLMVFDTVKYASLYIPFAAKTEASGSAGAEYAFIGQIVTNASRGVILKMPVFQVWYHENVGWNVAVNVIQF